MSTTLQKKILVEKNYHRSRKPEINVLPDLTDFMTDLFFGAVDEHKKACYNLTGGGINGVDGRLMDEEEDMDFDDSTRSNTSRFTEEWLEETRLMVASSPRCDSPSRLVGSSPRISGQQARLSASSLDRRDPLSRSARRHRPVEGVAGEILSKSARHTRRNSASLPTSSTLEEESSTAAVHKWFPNILKPSNPNPNTSQASTPNPSAEDLTVVPLPPRLSASRKSRFQSDNPATQPQGIPAPTSRRTFSTTQVLSPPKAIFGSPQRRSVSSSTYSQALEEPLSPPKNLVQSAHRRSISKSTCSVESFATKSNVSNRWSKEEDRSQELGINGFLRRQRMMTEKILNGEIDAKANVVLAGPSNSTSSMVAAIGYAWLLENRMRMNRGEGERGMCVVVPVMNLKRERMWKQQQAAWLFHHVGLDATSLLFADEVDLESLMMTGQLSILVVGEDILKTNGEVGSSCTILTDNYCEDAYDLLQTPILKTLLLAGILLDTQNLDASSAFSMTRDAEAVELLSIGSAPNFRNSLFDQLMEDQTDSLFYDTLRQNYGRSPNERSEQKVPERKSFLLSPHKGTTNNLKNAKNSKNPTNLASPAKATTTTTQTRADTSRGKNKFFLAKWFGFGSK